MMDDHAEKTIFWNTKKKRIMQNIFILNCFFSNEDILGSVHILKNHFYMAWVL